MNKVVYILRGVSGCGKSTLAAELARGYTKPQICEADLYFMKHGKYEFDASQLGAAHAWCHANYLRALNDPNCDCVIVSNTNTKARDFKFYEKEAERRGIATFCLVVENRHGGRNTHGVPQEVLDRHADNIRNSLEL